MELCEHCRMPDDRHTSDCPTRLSRRQSPKAGNAKIIEDLTRWRTDNDVAMILRATMKRHSVDHLSGLPDEVLVDMHDAISTMLEESPINSTLGDPRRTV